MISFLLNLTGVFFAASQIVSVASRSAVFFATANPVSDELSESKSVLLLFDVIAMFPSLSMENATAELSISYSHLLLSVTSVPDSSRIYLPSWSCTVHFALPSEAQGLFGFVTRAPFVPSSFAWNRVRVAPLSSSLPVTSVLLIVTAVFGLTASQTWNVVPSAYTPPFSPSSSLEALASVFVTVPFSTVNLTSLGMMLYFSPFSSVISKGLPLLSFAASSWIVYSPSSRATVNLSFSASPTVVISAPGTIFPSLPVSQRRAFLIVCSPVTADLSMVTLVVFAASHIIKYGSLLSANFVRTRPPLAFSSAVKLSTLAFAPVHSTVPSALTSNLNSVVITL